jgi:hypothetical protein
VGSQIPIPEPELQRDALSLFPLIVECEMLTRVVLVWHSLCLYPGSSEGNPRRIKKQKHIQLMPELSKFYGIVIRMLFVREFTVHFYAYYEASELMIGVAPVRVIQGEAPARVRDLVLEWAMQHQYELLTAWNRMAQARQPAPIQPLV